MKNNGPVFRLKNGNYRIDLATDHRKLLTQLVEQLRDSLATTTDDANLRRLFPTAYNNDAKKDAEYQRLMRDELLESRLAAIDVTIKVIAQDDEISAEEIDAFARSIKFCASCWARLWTSPSLTMVHKATRNKVMTLTVMRRARPTSS